MNEIPVSKREIWFADSGTSDPLNIDPFLWPNNWDSIRSSEKFATLTAIKGSFYKGAHLPFSAVIQKFLQMLLTASAKILFKDFWLTQYTTSIIDSYSFLLRNGSSALKVCGQSDACVIRVHYTINSQILSNQLVYQFAAEMHNHILYWITEFRTGKGSCFVCSTVISSWYYF